MEKRKEKIVILKSSSRKETAAEMYYVGKLVHKTRRAVAKAGMLFSLLAAAPNFAACALQPEEACNVVEPEDRPLDHFFDQFDIREVQPLNETEKLKVDFDALKPEHVSTLLQFRFVALTELDINTATLFRVSEHKQGEVFYNFVGGYADLNGFLDELKRLDPNASLDLPEQNVIKFQVSGKNYRLEFTPYETISLTVDGVLYEWRGYNRQIGATFEEFHETPELRYMTNYDSTKTGLQRVVENKPLGESYKEFDPTGITPDGIMVPIGNVNDWLDFSRTLKMANLLVELNLSGKPAEWVRGKNLDALKKLIMAYPADNPAAIQSVWHDLLGDVPQDGCNINEFEEPAEVVARGMASNESYAVLNALWARLNGHQTSVYDIRLTGADGISVEVGATYLLYTTDAETGKHWLINVGRVDQLESEVTVEDLVKQNNQASSKDGVKMKIIDQVNF